MFKSASLSFTAPFVKSQTKTQGARKVGKVSWASPKPVAVSRSRNTAVLPDALPVLSLMLVVTVASLLLLHLFWVNTYSAKGFELKKVQTAIAEQTELQKKLMIQQSMLSSSVNLSNLDQTGMVAVTDEEHLNQPSFAAVK